MFVLYKLFGMVCMFDMPFRGLKSEENELHFLHVSGKCNELAKRECCAKRSSSAIH